MAKSKSDPHKAIAAAVKDKINADGMVKVYPTEPIGENRVPNIPVIPQEVSPALAQDLLEFQPPAFTLYESGNPMPEQKHWDEAASEAAWGVSKPEDAPEVVSDMSPPFPATEPEKEIS